MNKIFLLSLIVFPYLNTTNLSAQKGAQPKVDSSRIVLDMENKVKASNANTLSLENSTSIVVMAVTLPTSFNYYVAINGSNSNPGTEASPFATIQKAIDVSVTGNAIKVKPGTYYENIDFKGKSIKVIGSPECPTWTTINGRGITHVVQMIARENSSTLLSGFTITNGNAVAATDYHTSKGGGIYLFDNANPTLSQLIITGNNASFGGGISALHSASPTLENVLIYNNSATGEGGAAYFYNGVYPKLTNVTIGRNLITGNAKGAFYLSRSAIVTMRNCIMWDAENLYEIVFNSATTNNSSCTITFNYSDKRGGQSGFVNFGTSGYVMTVSWGSGNLNNDPNFVNYFEDNFHLMNTSLCIDAGDPASIYSDAFFPPSTGTMRNDLGVYGGPSVWTQPEFSIVRTASVNQNYIQTLTPRVKVANDGIWLMTEDQVDNKIQYFDGLGRLIQSIDVEASPKQHDIIQPKEYDAFGRQAKEFLSYVRSVGISGEFVSTAINDQQNYYNTLYSGEGLYAKSEKKFDNSSLNRTIQQGAPGAVWQPNAHPLRYEYTANAAPINKYKIDASGNCVADGTHDINKLNITITKNENWSSGNDNTAWEYKDNAGRTVLNRTYESNIAHDTYYVYNDLGLLVCVIPPLADGIVVNELCYFYKYDERNRMIEKKIPGCNEAVFMIYDNWDRLVLVQNSVDRTPKNWLFTKYDVLNRPIMTGKIQIPDKTADQLRTEFKTYVGPMYETVVTTGDIGYTLDKSFPTTLPSISSNHILTINYYDNYDFRVISGFNSLSFSNENDIDAYFDDDGIINGYFDRVVNLNTGTKIKVLDGNELTASAKWLCNVNYFDDRSRLIQMVQSLYDDVSGKDIISTQYDFIGNVLQTRQMQLYNGITTTINKYYQYDHSNRLIKTQQKIEGDPNGIVTLADVSYNELGQIKIKNLHRTATGYIQQLDYGYNIRGWLKNINDPNNIGNDLFAMNLLYEDASSLTYLPKENQFNGNISGIVWKTKINSGPDYLKSAYTYTYDKLNRLLESYYGEGESLVSQEKFREYNYRYDKNGNIKWLKRKNASGILMDDMEYAYESTTSNRLKSITDYGIKTEGFNDVTNLADYTYDANGNLNQDLNKEFISITYNYLDLPYVFMKIGYPTLRYIYDALGRKLMQITNIAGTTSSTYYMGNLEYDNSKSLSQIQMDEGAVTKSSGAYVYEYRIKDHLGNTRVVFKPTTDGTPILLQKTDYYPFGQTFNNQYAATDNQYLYNGKEFQNEFGLNLYDYGARFYDPQIGRFTGVDPVTEKYPSWSPYSYVFDNPINGIDPDGRDGIIIVFPNYKVDTEIKVGSWKAPKMPLGHAGVLLIDNKTGRTKYYEYGRYPTTDGTKGRVRNVRVSDVVIGKDGKPTLESLNKVMGQISKKSGQGGEIRGAYVISDKFTEMNNYAKEKLNESNPGNSDYNKERESYDVKSNNCGTFAADVVNQDESVDQPGIVNPTPNNIVDEYIEEGNAEVDYNPTSNTTMVGQGDESDAKTKK